MANYPKTPMPKYPKPTITKRPANMYNGKWEKTTNLPGFPNTTKYTRWYENNRIDLYREGRSNLYTYTIVRDRDGAYIRSRFRAPSLQKAQDRVDLMIENENW